MLQLKGKIAKYIYTYAHRYTHIYSELCLSLFSLTILLAFRIDSTVQLLIYISKLLKILPEWIADEQLNINENRCFKEEDPELSSTLHSHYMFSLTSSYAHSTLPNLTDFFQHFCMKLWLWPHSTQDCWLKSMPPQHVLFFQRSSLPPGGWGREVHTHIGGCPSRKPCRLTSESPKFDFFQIWQSGGTPDLETQGKQKRKAIDPVFGIHILVTFKYIFSKLTYGNVIILLNIHVYFHSTYIHDIKEKMGS